MGGNTFLFYKINLFKFGVKMRGFLMEKFGLFPDKPY